MAPRNSILRQLGVRHVIAVVRSTWVGESMGESVSMSDYEVSQSVKGTRSPSPNLADHNNLTLQWASLIFILLWLSATTLVQTCSQITSSIPQNPRDRACVIQQHPTKFLRVRRSGNIFLDMRDDIKTCPFRRF